ncbi:metallophosphoesterase family protein [Corynebacterium crudilactis]|uniref:Nuclease SbcCD subunit D n=1 Tax=Corynebacterium crudilactis TaxID=1652495 RepID=A0A172QSS5_9CORY|nr:exonuclease SbcCD subunit D [Corynebacterium crudilactis]ANE03736.1 DNA repair exonuclease [Corynebacterium crudilactis]
MSTVHDEMSAMNTTVKFLHSSDLQIGMTRWFLSDEAQARFDDDRIRAIEKMGRVAREYACEFIVLAGDVFEHNSLEQRTTGRALEALRSLKMPVYLLPGNHDPLTADSLFYRAKDIAGVTILADTQTHQISPGVEIIGAPLQHKIATSDLVADALKDLEPTDSIRIAVGHGQAEARTTHHRADLIDLHNVEAKLAEGIIDYLALGDTHSAQPVGTSGKVWFSGAPETTDFHDLDPERVGGEVNSGKVLVVTASKEAVEVEEIEIGKWTFQAFSRDISSTEDVQEFLDTLRAYPDKSRTVIKYGLRGTITLEQNRLLEEGIAELEDVFASLKPRERTTDLVLEPGEEELANLDATGYAAEVLRELADSVVNGAAPEEDRDALNLLFRLSREV